MNATRKVKLFKKRSRSESESEQGDELQGFDAKRDDLSVARLKAG